MIEERLRALGAGTHVFGHSHINLDLVIDGVRYVQNALDYPREFGRPRTYLPIKLLVQDCGAPSA